MKYCVKCGKELVDEAVLCPGCGCWVDEKPIIKQDYPVILRKTKVFLIIGLVLLALGLFCWIATYTLGLIYTVIGEHFHHYILGERIPSGMYRTCDMLAKYSSCFFFFLAEFLFLIPRNKFNSAFKRENQALFARDKAQYKQAVQEKNRELNKTVPFYRIIWFFALAACILFVISVFIPGLSII